MNVSLYFCDSNNVAFEDEELTASLSDDELQRANRLRFARHRRTYCVGRKMMRAVLGKITGRAPQSLRFEYGEAGKPGLSNGPAFNLSHTGSSLLLAVTEHGQVGIDIEACNDSRDLDALAQRCFSDSERAQFDAAPPSDRTGSFYRAWTRKEALIKALGGGLSIDLQAFSVSLADSESNVLVDGNAVGAGDGWAIRPLHVTDGTEAAVALDQAAFSVTTRLWTADSGVVEP